MSLPESPEAEPLLPTRRSSTDAPERAPSPTARRTSRFLKPVLALLALLVLLGVVGWFAGGYWMRSATRAALPQLDGTLTLPGLSAPVTVQRDAQGVPHLRAASVDDLLVAQGFVTAQDRMFQMDLLRRHAAGTLAEILGAQVIGHDRLQRTLQIRAAADRAIAQLPPDQMHVLERYAAGVNAYLAAQSARLPIEFRLLRYQPEPWTPRDSLLVQLAMFEDLTNEFPRKLARESLVARLAPTLPADQRAQLEQDLYPVGSWRDHPPTQPVPDLTVQGPPIEDVPLDESQNASLHEPALPGRDELASQIARLFTQACMMCMPGSNNWVVSGAHTASGKPLLSNDMHLGHNEPGIWYEADLAAASGLGGAPFHAAGVSLPGLPLIVVGHNDHIAWGFTNLGADVQDVYLEKTRGSGKAEEFQATDGSWQPVLHLAEPIRVHGGREVQLEVLATRHGEAVTPILNPALDAEVAAPHGKARTLALRWTIYDPTVLGVPTLDIDSAHDWTSFLAGFERYGGPAQNVVYADDQGHIGYHAMGRVPLRGGPQNGAGLMLDEALPTAQVGPEAASQQTPVLHASAAQLDTSSIKAPQGPTAPQLSGPLSPVPIVPTAAREWSGYIPFSDLPQVFDPLGGVIATANARTAPDDYAYPLTLDWAAPYRNERIWHLLGHRKNLTPADMLAIQGDIYSDFDRMLAERLTYALDHATQKRSAGDTKRLHQAAELLRTFNGRMATDSAAAQILSDVHRIMWPVLLQSKLQGRLTATTVDTMYTWGERDYALEQVLMHQPPRWLPAGAANWDEALATVVLTALAEGKAPADLGTWRYGAHHTVDIEHPIFSQSPLLQRLIGVPIGTGNQPQSGDHTTIKQVDHTFGPSERFTADLANPDRTTLNIVTGQSGNVMSPWFLDQFQAWLHGTTFPLAWSQDAVQAAATHTLTLTPR